MRTLRIVPDLRSSVVEEKPPTQLLLHTSRRSDMDAALLARPDVVAFSWAGLRRALADPELELIEVAEPLWLGEWAKAVRYVLVAHVVRATRPGRRRVAVATYAIENVEARERLALPSPEGGTPAGRRVARLLGRPVTTLRIAGLGLSMLLLDAVVFGTSGAAANYRRSFGWALRRARQTVLPPRTDACRTCDVGPASASGGREPVVLFLGTPSERKGFDVLVRAWELADGVGRGWRLVVADPAVGATGPGATTDRGMPDGVSVVSPDRAGVHRLLRTSTVVAMPSVRRPGWREQIGLPLVEGLAHGCRVVTTPETGLADDLHGHPLVVFTPPGDPHGLAAGLRVATRDTVPETTAPRAGHTKRDVTAWWLDAR